MMETFQSHRIPCLVQKATNPSLVGIQIDEDSISNYRTIPFEDGKYIHRSPGYSQKDGFTAVLLCLLSLQMQLLRHSFYKSCFYGVQRSATSEPGGSRLVMRMTDERTTANSIELLRPPRKRAGYGILEILDCFVVVIKSKTSFYRR